MDINFYIWLISTLGVTAFAWLIFGMLLVWFSVGDYKESKSG
ncbi:hypothetical protein OAD71_02520 [Gammaproteobacteria bacterium]|nr:hypothetical protein [Gammaproteobacteria bacterium]